MIEYFVIEKQSCPACAGRGRRCREDRPAFTGETICLDCDGSGTQTREVPLAEALAALERARVPSHSLEEAEAEFDRLMAEVRATKGATRSATKAPAKETRRSVSGEEMESERPGWEWHREQMRKQGVPEAALPSLVEWTQYRWALAGMKSGGCPPEGLPSFTGWRAETEDTP